MESLRCQKSYITLKDHKEDFQNNPKVRLINPAKLEIGKVANVILQEINNSTFSVDPQNKQC